MLALTSIIVSLIALVAGPVLGHMEVIDPYPILSPANPAVHWADKNYDMMAPLLWDGLPYPCKGYLWTTPEKERVTQKTWPAGSWQSITLGPNGAPHKGGSCQISMSYDYGRTWQVILSIMGGCPTDGYKMDFEIPSEAPSGHTVFSWSWFNHEGNREMYMNCFIIDIINGGAGLPTRDYPPPFVANANVNGCSTIEGVDPIFPNPGKNVRWGGPYRGQQIWEQRGIRGSNCVDWNAHEMPAGAMGRTGYEPPPAPSSSSTSSLASTTSFSSSTTESVESSTSTTTSSSVTSTATATTSDIGNNHNASPLPSSSPSSTTTEASSMTISIVSSTTLVPSPSRDTSAASETETSSSTSSEIPSATSSTLSTSPAVSSSSTSAMAQTSSSTTHPGESSSMITFDPSPTSIIPETSSTTVTRTDLPSITDLPSSSSSSSSTSLPSSSLTSTTDTTTVNPSTLPTIAPGNSTCKRVVRRSFDGLSGPGGKERPIRRVIRQVKAEQVVQKAW